MPSCAVRSDVPCPNCHPPRTAGQPISIAVAVASGMLLGSLGKLPVRIDDEFACDAGIEVFVAFRRLLKVDHLDIDDLGDRQPVPKYRLHELPVVFQHRRLAGVEAMGLFPAEAEAQAEVTLFGRLLLRTRD